MFGEGGGGQASLIECYCFKSRSGGSSLEGYICETGGVRLYSVDAAVVVSNSYRKARLKIMLSQQLS